MPRARTRASRARLPGPRGARDTVWGVTADQTPAASTPALADEPEVRAALAERERGAVDEVVAEHPSSPLAWAELADVADSKGRPVDAFAYAVVAVDLACGQLKEAGWKPGTAVSWSDEPNRAYLRALDAQRRAARALGLDARADRLAEELRAADADAPARIASEFTPTQILSLADVEAAVGRTTPTFAVTGDQVTTPGSFEAGGAVGAGED
jgi:hypothetical protein